MPPKTIEADICIVGSGAAGLVLASQFLYSDVRVCVIESGAKEPASEPDPLYEFESTNLPISPRSRARAFGGTTTKWSGRWKPLEGIDFTKRDWIEYSGWPVTHEEMLPYYERARHLFDMPDCMLQGKHIRMPELRDSPIEYVPFQFQAKNKRKWAEFFYDRLHRSENISLHFNSHVLRIQKNGRLVERVFVQTAAKQPVAVAAKIFVLALGGIENPRMLLVSDIGNEYDQVGRYFMDHPKGASGLIEGYRPMDLTDSAFFDNTNRTSFALRLSDSFQKKHTLLNSHIYLEALSNREPMSLIASKIFSASRVSPVAIVRNYLEQAPDPANRITLGSARDTFGNPRAKVEWRVGKLDKKTIKTFHELLQTELPRLKIGELKSPLIEKPDEFAITQDASHHMGTTRMGDDPKTSVVDADSRVHSIDNLYVAGSSVFPTGGAGGPVATIAALSLRLADHLKTIL